MPPKPTKGLANPEERSGDRHLASDPELAALTRLELGVMRMHEAFGGWIVEVHKQAKGPQLSFQDISLLHAVRLRGGTPTLSEMLTFQHRHDLSSLQYGFKKLEAQGLLWKVKTPSKRETAHEITPKGLAITDRYAELRQKTLVKLLADISGGEETLHGASAVLERMIGLYDQATQTLLNEHILYGDSFHAPVGDRSES